MKKLLALFVLFTILVFAQDKNPYPATPSQKRIEAFQKRMEMRKTSLLKNVKLRSIGPTIMSGRVVDVSVDPQNSTIFYVAYATGGLWKTTDNGISFKPMFGNQASMTIGDIAVDWKHGETIWIGTGENNSSRSSYAGTGVYKSVDSGKTWQSMGLAETQHIGRIVLDPDDPNTVWVAAIGHLYSPNPERGVYKTTDGGKTWKKVLYIDENTGAIDLTVDPQNPKILYAAMWYRIRRAWNFIGAGKTSGIYKSIDGGNTWSLLTTEGSGFPTGKGVGRIGLSIYPKNPQIIYAVLDNQFHRKKEKGKKEKLTREKISKMSKEEFLKISEKDLRNFMKKNSFPKKYTVKKIFEMIKDNKITPKDVANYLEDAEQQLFDTPVIGTEVYRSDNGGKTWTKRNKKYIDDMFYTYGYYFGQIRVNPRKDKEIYLAGVPAIKSEDGGKTYKLIGGPNVHADFHALWIDPDREGHLIVGNDGGVNITYDNGKTWFKANTPAVGQFYSVTVDMEKPYNVYGGLQDNGVWYGPHNYTPNYAWYSTGQYPFKRLLGGDGMDVAVDTTNNNLVYCGFQFGYYFRVNKETHKSVPVKPVNNIGTPNLRFNWETPIKLSSHNHDIFYIGSNILYRSLDKGKDLKPISGDLTNGGKSGNVPYGTLTTIDESPLKFGLIYTGSDDGLVYLTKDGGNNWELISKSLPQNLWVSRVVASSHDTGTVYVTLNGYRWDDFAPYLYRSTDYGKTWEKLGKDLPYESINVVREDPVNKDILYVGTDHGVYVSLDSGKNFMVLFDGMPQVPVHDLAVQSRDKNLVIGTHGRSIYVTDVKYIEKLTPKLLAEPVHLFHVENIRFNKNWGNKNYTWGKPDLPSLQFVYYSGSNDKASITILTDDNKELKNISAKSDHGLNYYDYDLTIDSNKVDFYKKFINSKLKNDNKYEFKKTDTGNTYLHPGKYKVVIEINGKKSSQEFVVKESNEQRHVNEEMGP